MTEHTTSFSWGHINVNVTDLDQSIAFYQKLGFELLILGIPYLGLNQDLRAPAVNMTEALDLEADVTGRACIMQLGQGYPKLDLTQWQSADASRPLNSSDVGIVRLCLGTSNLAEDYAHLLDQGVTFITAPQSAHRGMADIATCLDPDGAQIELIQVHYDKWPKNK